MDYLLNGIKTDKRSQKALTKMVLKLGYGLNGGIMERREKKKLIRMGK